MREPCFFIGPGSIATSGSPLNADSSPHSILFSRQPPQRYHTQICRFGLPTLRKTSRFTASALRLCARPRPPLTPTPPSLPTLHSPLLGVFAVFAVFVQPASAAILTIGRYPFRILYCYTSCLLLVFSFSATASCSVLCVVFYLLSCAILPHRSAAHSLVRRPQPAVVAQRHADHRWREVCLPVLHQGPPRERLQPHWYFGPMTTPRAHNR